MLPIYRPSILDNCQYFDINMIYNSNTLNIFSDASMKKIKKKGNVLSACYGAVALSEDHIVDEMIRVQSLCTVPAAELRGIRCSLYLALKYRNLYRVINIFSDSLYAITSIRDFAMDWIWDSKNEYYKYNKFHPKSSRPIQNQELIYECIMLINELRKTNIINIFHQRGHIQSSDEMVIAKEAFKKYNGFTFEVSFNIIRYISMYNNLIDEKTRNIIKYNDFYSDNYIDPVVFKPNPNIYLN